uniref:CSON003582 protein n=1 Tax=Culicoides sonorensis TaxID=179676 RepID=A0A336MNT5_CULSO
MIYQVIIFTIVIFFILSELKRLHLSYQLRHIPGPTEIPFIGCKYILSTNKITDIESLCYEICTDKTVKMFVLHRIAIVTSDCDLLKIILNDKACADRPYVFKFLDLEYGLSSSKYNFWRPLRKGLNCTFNQQVINDLIPTFDKNYSTLIGDLMQFVNTGAFDIHEVISNGIFASISETIFHEIIKGDFGPHELEEIEDIICQRIINPLLHLNVIYKMTSLYKRERQIRHAIYEALQQFITKRRIEILSNADLLTSKNILDRLITMKVNGKALDDMQITENLTNLLVGGFETTASALCYTLLALAMHPQAQEKCFEEINEVFQGKFDFKPDKMKNLKYLDMVIKETLRLFPPVPVSARENFTDINFNGVTIPKKTILVLNIFQLHRNPDYWGEKCLEFYPEHFLPENIENRDFYTYLPFTAGSRNCIGTPYALTSIKVGLVHILSKFRLKTPLKMNELKFKFSITLKITNGFMIELNEQ